MAPTKRHLAMFLAIALIAAMPHPSAAVRAEPPATSSTTSPPPPKWNIPGLSSLLPSCFRWPPIFSPTPPPPPPPPPSKPPPKECLTPLLKQMPCKDYVTNSTAPAPPRAGSCCDGYRSLMEDTPICLCWIADYELDKLMAAPVLYPRFLVDLLDICQVEPPGPDCNGYVPPMNPAPSPEAAP